MTHTSGAYLRIDPPTEYVLVQQHHDGSDLLRVFGPFASLEASDAAKDALREAGVEDGVMVAMPLREVEMNERPAAVSDETDACGATWEATVSEHCARHSCVLDPEHGAPEVPHRCPCGVTAQHATAPALAALADSISKQYQARATETRKPGGPT